MVDYISTERRVNFRRNAMLVDTNVLVGAFDSADRNHEDARFLLDEADWEWLVPTAVVVEAWGLLVGRSKNWPAAMQLLAWLNTPGKAILIREDNDVDPISQIIKSVRIDCVDAMLICSADHITASCSMNPHMTIATFDTRDYLLARAKLGKQLTVYDARTSEML